MTKELFIVILDAQPSSETLAKGAMLSLHPYTAQAAHAALLWQKQGGWDMSNYKVCSPAHGLPGVMEWEDAAGVLSPILVANDNFKTTAWAVFLSRVWEVEA